MAGKRTSKIALAVLDNAIRHLDMTDKGTCVVSPEHKEAIRLYLSTWVEGPLRSLDGYLKGNLEAWEIEHWARSNS